ncbi:hypothetical protein MNBD_GAMMA11-3341 [hydrothermal vent metagenome]|uniref:Uncharacterized protein n=1 Tax=hydrothermal vent metagenome TaxID=652676 RepID=A0A3B0XDN2_9ZZZZ
MVCLLIAGNISNTRAEDLHLLMVTDKSNDILPLSKDELRRLFLGMPVYRNGQKLKAVINRSDEMCYQIFLQYILGMSHKRYVHTMVSSLYRNGIKTPPTFTAAEEIIEYIHKEKYSVTYIFKHNLPKFNNLNVVQEIWVSRTP